MAISIEDINETNRDEFGGDYELVRSTIDKYGRRHSVNRADLPYLTISSIFAGDIIFKENPALQFNFRWVTRDKTPRSKAEWMHMTMLKGYEPCKYDDWDIRPELREYWVRNGDGTIGLAYDETTILVFRSRERFEQEEERTRKQFAHVLGGDSVGTNDAIENLTRELRKESGGAAVESFGKLEMEEGRSGVKRGRK